MHQQTMEIFLKIIFICCIAFYLGSQLLRLFSTYKTGNEVMYFEEHLSLKTVYIKYFKLRYYLQWFCAYKRLGDN